MSQLNKKILVSGCGFSYSGQERKTWVNVLKSVGANITDVGGPAVSNQWVLNKTINELMINPTYDSVVVQLTSMNKLDVEVDFAREAALVKSDLLRNFIFKGVWPSSHSTEHPAKAMYQSLLYSPGLDLEDVYCKLMLLSDWCGKRGIQLVVLQAYALPWTPIQLDHLVGTVLNLGEPLYTEYQESSHYRYHDHFNSNTVPCIQYHAELAGMIAGIVSRELTTRIDKIQKHFTPTK